MFIVNKSEKFASILVQIGQGTKKIPMWVQPDQAMPYKF